jgi:NitT/TauT family transport system substrate-binding protein
LASQPVSAEKIVLGVASPISFSFAPFVLAKAAGFLAAEDLDVDIVSFGEAGGGSGVLMPQVARGNVQIGWGGPSWLINARQPGMDYLPAKFFYNYNRTYGWEITAIDGNGVTTLADLKGKAVGIPSAKGASVPVLKAILKSAGLIPDRDIQLPVVGVGATALRALETRQVAAIDMIEIRRATLQMRGVKTIRLMPPERFLTIPSASFISSDSIARTKPKILIGWGRAIAKATVFCDEAPAACIEAFWKAYPDKKGSSGEEAEFAGMLKAKIAGQLPGGGSERFGEFAAQSWTTYLDILQESGEAKSKDVPLDSLYTGAFLDPINAFDRSEIRRAAREWRSK